MFIEQVSKPTIQRYLVRALNHLEGVGLTLNDLQQLEAIKNDIELSAILSEMEVLHNRFEARLAHLKGANAHLFDMSVFQSTPFHPSHS